MPETFSLGLDCLVFAFAQDPVARDAMAPDVVGGDGQHIEQFAPASAAG